MKKKEDLFTEIINVKLFVGTWNLAGMKPLAQLDFSEWIFPFKETFTP